MPDDAYIVREILIGDKEKFAVLIERYQSQILRLTTTILRDSELARDAAQETFLKAFRSLRKFRQDASLKTWLAKIATHTCIDMLRRKSRTDSASLEEAIERGSERFHSIFQEPLDVATLTEQREMINQVLDALPADYRTVLLLREVEDYSYDQIAEITGWSVESVRARLRRGRELLERFYDR